MLPIVCTYWWAKKANEPNDNTKYDYYKKETCVPKSYSQLINDLKTQCERLGLAFYSKRIKYDNYQDNINYKPQFIQHCLQKMETTGAIH